MNSVPLWLIPLCLCGWFACSRAPAPPPLVAQVSGSLAVAGLSAPVRVVRDRWGVPHIYATSEQDLFLAQGFVQAQDRLFQMDLWRRASQGRLSGILGSNFIERDAMTRRMQYRGDVDVEWASYGPAARAIATAFVRGVNAWVALARARPPEEFVAAGWLPQRWSPNDLLSRTDAFVASAGAALDEIGRRGLNDLVAAAIRRVGTRPFLIGMATPERAPLAAPRVFAARGQALFFSEPPRMFRTPSPRYFVHLHAPGWNVAGATRPWLPGVALGHNDRVAWGMAPADLDTQDIYVDRVADIRRAPDVVAVKGRTEPFRYDREFTLHGVVVASDRPHGVVYTVRWSGFEPGAAAELGSLALDRAGSPAELRAALTRWKMPPRRVVYADANGDAGFQEAALVPVRRGGEWDGWMPLDQLPHGDASSPGDRARAAAGAASSASPPSAGDSQVVFAHVLAVTAERQRRFDIGPMARPSADDSPVRATLDPTDWDRSSAANAPGQSESPASPHFSDLARLWSVGQDFPLAFSDAAVAADAESTLTLVPVAPAAPTADGSSRR